MKKQKSPKSLNQAIELVNQELLEMFLKKHKDYGKGNILAVKELGIAMRISEKTERLKHLLMSGNLPSNEPRIETWIDIAVYAEIAIMLERGWFQELEVEE
ncbi:MAG: hypothetical protein WAU07_00855 [Microgenomates group bacterium]